MAGLLDAIQAASNTAADTVAGPVDIIAALLRAAGLQVNKPIGGTDWMLEKGLKKPVEQSASRVAGETLGMLSPVVAAAKAPQIAKGLLEAGREWQAYNRELGPAGASQATVWHGSPHKFDKFDSGKIGTGEGAQAYGHGLYFGGNQTVGGTYIRAGRNVGFENWDDVGRLADKAFAQAGGDSVKAMGLLDDLASKTSGRSRKLNAQLAKQVIESGTQQASLYKVDLPDNLIARMLDWDKPLNQQAPDVQVALQRAYRELGMTFPAKAATPKAGAGLYDDVAKGFNLSPNSRQEAANSHQMASDYLRELGIPGIRYLDGGSRGAGQGTYNYVVFPGEENALTILERNGMPIGR